MFVMLRSHGSKVIKGFSFVTKASASKLIRVEALASKFVKASAS